MSGVGVWGVNLGLQQRSDTYKMSEEKRNGEDELLRAVSTIYHMKSLEQRQPASKLLIDPFCAQVAVGYRGLG